MKKIISLTITFAKESYQNLNLWNKKTGKVNKKSTFFWLLGILFLGISYISYSIIKLLIKAQRPQLFLNCYFLVTAVLLLFQMILICANVFFFSKDSEKVLYMPIKPIELLITKFNILVFMLYATEIIFCIMPFTLYGLMTHSHLSYYLWEIILLSIFPVLIVTIVSICTFLIMKFFRYIKNKQTSQFLISMVLLLIFSLMVFFAIQKGFHVDTNRLFEVNKYFLIINPSAEILANPSHIGNVLVSFSKIIFYNIVGIVIFLTVFSKGYIKEILLNMNSITKRKKKFEIKKKFSKKNRMYAYISKEIKNLIREPVFFIQCIFPILTILIMGIIAVKSFFPIFMEMAQKEGVAEIFQNITLDREILCYILIIMQVIDSISNISLTAISREGKNAILMKYIPIDLYKQFKYKNVPQVVLNVVASIVILIMVKYMMPEVEITQFIYIFIIALLINLINSYLMLIVDLRRPNLDWDTPYLVVKRSDNKIFQYVLMILNVLLLMYISNIFKEIAIEVTLIAELIIYLVIFIIIDRCVKKWKNELFNKIN